MVAVNILQVWLLGFGAVALLMFLTWVVSAVRRDASLVDRVWGAGFVVAAWAFAIAGETDATRTWLVLGAVTIWGLRLSAHITWRNWGEGEDKRYAAMRSRRPATFTGRSLVTVFGLQALLAAVIALPLLGALTRPGAAGVLDVVALIVWTIGFVFETVADVQLARFNADPSNRRRVLDRGVWRWSRHPNYFGDTMVWWGYGLFGLAAGAWWGLFGSLLMTLLIVRVSGVALTEKNMAASPRQGHAEYVRRTRAFVPGPRRR